MRRLRARPRLTQPRLPDDDPHSPRRPCHGAARSASARTLTHRRRPLLRCGSPPGSIPGWRRELHDNSLDGTLPPEYSTMTELGYLCVAYARGRA